MCSEETSKIFCAVGVACLFVAWWITLCALRSVQFSSDMTPIDPGNPRNTQTPEHLGKDGERYLRALNHHQEQFAFGVAAVLINLVLRLDRMGTTMGCITGVLALVYGLSRVAHAIAYIKDWAMVRIAFWSIGQLILFALFGMSIEAAASS